MLSLQQAYEVKVSIIEYLKATYSFQDKEVEKVFLRLVENENDGMFKGPYISLKLPYKKFEGDLDNLNIAIRPPFRPFVHQAVVFDRLSTNNNHQPLPTVLQISEPIIDLRSDLIRGISNGAAKKYEKYENSETTYYKKYLKYKKKYLHLKNCRIAYWITL